MAKEITLQDLMNNPSSQKTTTESNRINESFDSSTATTASIKDLGKDLEKRHPEAIKEEVVEESPIVANAFSSMEKTLKEKKDFIENEVMPIVRANAEEMALENELGEKEDLEEETEEKELEDEDTTEESVEGVFSTAVEEDKEEVIGEVTSDTTIHRPKTKHVEKDEEFSKDDIDEDFDSLIKDIEDDTDTLIDEEDESPEEVKARFKESMESIKISKNVIDLSQYKMAKEPISSSAILSTISKPEKKYCDFPMLSTGRNMRFEECSGPELDALKKTINNSNGINGVIAAMRFIYNHNVDANKKDFETWTKSIRTEDIESLYFGLYKATYGDCNILAYYDDKESKGCDKTILVDTDIDTMYKIDKDEDKELFESLRHKDTTNPGSRIKSDIMVISDKLAISYMKPTLYTTFIQFATIKPEIREKYEDYINTLAYIDGFYLIDDDTKSLVPISYKIYPKNINKTILSKLHTYIDIIKTLTSDQYNIMTGKLDNIIEEPKIKFINPECTCTECGNKIKESSVDSMLQLLFSRAQLVRIKSL